MKKIFIYTLVILIFNQTAPFLEGTYVPGELIISIKENALPQKGLFINDLEQIPKEIKNLVKFLGAKNARSLIRHKIENLEIVKTLDKPLTFQQKKQQLKAEAFAQSGIARTILLTFDSSSDMESIAAQLRNNPEIEYVEPNYYVQAFASPNDTHFQNNNQWYLNTIEAPSGWNLVTGNTSVVIAVIDSGMRITHDDLDGKLWSNPGEVVNGADDDSNGYLNDYNGWNFVSDSNNVNDDYGHGTRVAGIIAAETNNGQGVAGVDWNAKLMTLKALNNQGGGTIDDLVAAVYYAINNDADVINMSLGTSQESTSLEKACIAAKQANIVCVAAMGNSGDEKVFYPAGFSSVIGVGSTNDNDELSVFSTYGSGASITEVTAPGENIYSTTMTNDSGYGYEGASVSMPDGTSFASPIVAGLVGLLKAQNPNMTVQQLRERIHLTANDLGSHGPDKYFGHGRVNIANALSNTQPSNKGLEISQLMNFPNPATNKGTTFSFYLEDSITYEIKIYTPHGTLLKTIDGGSSSGPYHKVKWDCKDEDENIIPNGTYIYVLVVEGTEFETLTKKGKMAMLQ